MPKFDIPGRTEPTRLVLYRDNQERVYPLPFDATDQVDIDALTAEGLEIVPEPEPEPEPLEHLHAMPMHEHKPRPSRKEVEPE